MDWSQLQGFPKLAKSCGMDKQLSLSTIRHRRGELNQEAEKLRTRLSQIAVEAAELEAAESLVFRLGVEVEPDAAKQPLRFRSVVVADTDRTLKSNWIRHFHAELTNPSTKDLLISVMRQTPNVWTTANEVQARVSERKGVDVPMSTISPYLSELKRDEIIVRNGMKVALKARLNENEPPNGKPEDGSETALHAQ